MSEWNYTSDGKPAKFGRYLFALNYCGAYTGWYLPKYDVWISDERKEYDDREVTNWMDLPRHPLAPGMTCELQDEVDEIVANTKTDIDLEFALKHNFRFSDG